ncbi:MAG: winged helix-turn-helix transcriptional regulator [Proteobacteria bacterium]|nr:winged helix-turn-helix transcriptional regulator [Pseudomonadota bacterium]NDG26427.1 winged helix-turn-helix transcriptional regulator [Pseudomonadota bacterium]
MDKKKLQDLQKKWYSKLAKSGFKDIENVFLPGEPLLHWDSTEFQRAFSPSEFTERQRYYELAGQLLHTFKFKKDRDKEIWRMYVQGITQRKIAKAVGLSIISVNRIIKKYASYIKYNSD